MRVVADSHAVVWYLNGSPRLSRRGRSALADAEATEGVVVSVASLVDLWYVTQTTRSVTPAEVAGLRDRLEAAAGFQLWPVDVSVAEGFMAIPHGLLSDPWDRFIVATAQAVRVPLVTRDEAITDASLVPTIW